MTGEVAQCFGLSPGRIFRCDASTPNPGGVFTANHRDTSPNGSYVTSCLCYVLVARPFRFGRRGVEGCALHAATVNARDRPLICHAS